MAQRDKYKLLEWLHRAEAESDVLAWRAGGIHLWPFIRHKITYEYVHVKQISLPFPIRTFRKVQLIFKGAFECLQLMLSRKAIDFIFLSKATYRAMINDVWMDRFCDSIIEFAGAEARRKSLILESGVDMKYRKPRFRNESVQGVQGILYLLGILAPVIGRIRKSQYTLSGFSEFKQRFSELVDVRLTLSEQVIKKQFDRVLVLADFFEWYLKRVEVKKVFLVCFHEEYGYAMTLACSRLGIPSVDIQHGVEGRYHYVYTPYLKIPATGFDLVPDKFWVWDTISFDNILNWGNENHTPFLGGNVWLKHCQANKVDVNLELSKPVILVSLQPLEDALPDMLLEAMRDTANVYYWFLRMHPRQFSERQLLEDRLDQYGLLESVNLNEASNLPLPVLLNLASVHITQWSSVVFEAFEMGVPSIVIHQTGKMMYQTEEFEKDFVYFSDTADDLKMKVGELKDKKRFLENEQVAYADRVKSFVNF